MAVPLVVDATEARDLLTGAFAGFHTVLLAVSGGADSMALMYLAARWQRMSGTATPRLLTATVDHGLRPEAAREAAWVGKQAAALGLDHATLVWQGAKPTSGVQEAARDARYELLAEYLTARASPPSAIAVAHHLDDQAETLLMRLARGSGVDGLAGMRARRELPGRPGFVLVRPLLGIPKARLLTTVSEAGLEWLEDPSNEIFRFERVRVRRAAPSLAAAGLGNSKLALSATRLARARVALEHATAELEEAAVDYHDGAYAVIERQAFFAAPEEIALRLLSRVLEAMGGQEAQAPMSRLESLLARLCAEAVRGTTLAGCHVEVEGQQIRVYREAGRLGLPVEVLKPGRSVVWDRRFWVESSAKLAQRLEIRALPAPSLTELREGASTAEAAISRMPRRAALTLPSIWDGDRLLAVPHLDYWQDGGDAAAAGLRVRRVGPHDLWQNQPISPNTADSGSVSSKNSASCK